MENVNIKIKIKVTYKGEVSIACSPNNEPNVSLPHAPPLPATPTPQYYPYTATPKLLFIKHRTNAALIITKKIKKKKLQNKKKRKNHNTM